MLATSKKSYEGMLNPDQRTTDLLVSTSRLHANSCRLFGDILLTLFAGIDSSFHEFFTDAKKKKSSAKQSKKDEDKPQASLFPPPEVFSFLAWFGAESADSPHPQYAISSEQLLPRFIQYFGKEVDVSVVKFFREFTLEEGAYWIDRRAVFNDMNKTLGLTYEDMRFMFGRNDLPLFRGGETSHKYWRTLFSAAWGSGEKGNHEGQAAFYKKLLDEPSLWLSDNPYKFSESVKTFLGIKTKPEMRFLSGIHTGNDDIMLKIVFSPGLVSKLDIKNVRKKLESSIEHKRSIATPTEAILKLKDHVGALLGVPFRLNDRDNINHYSEFAGCAWERIISTKTNNWRQCCDYISKSQERDAIVAKQSDIQTYVDIIREFEEEQKESCQVESYEFRKNQLQGIHNFVRVWKTEEDFDKSLTAARDAFVGKFGSHAFFNWLYMNFRETAGENFASSLENAMSLLDIEARMKRARIGKFQHFGPDSFVPMNFGDSRPRMLLIGKNNQTTQRLELNEIALELWDANENKFVNVQIPFRSKRAIKEVFFAPFTNDNKYTVIRNHSLARLDAGVSRNDVIGLPIDWLPSDNDGSKNKVGTKVYQRVGYGESPRWYASLAPELTAVNEIHKTQINVGSTLLGINLGHYNAAAYSVLEVSNKGFTIENKDGKICNVVLIDRGLIESPKHVLNAKGRGPTAEELYQADMILTKIYKPLEKLSDHIQVTYCSLMKTVTNSLRIYCSKTKVPTEADVDLFMSTSELISPSIKDIRNKGRIIGVGALTYDRIETFFNIYRAGNSLAKRLEGNQLVAQQVQRIADSAFTKYQNMRKERHRITTNMILRCAIENNCNCIVLEDMDNLAPNLSRYRYENRRLGSWYQRRILADIKQNAPLYGINVLLVNPYRTSHTDPLTGEPLVRMNEVNLMTCSIKTEDAKMRKILAQGEDNTPEAKKVLHAYAPETQKILDEYGASDFASLRATLLSKDIKSIFLPQIAGWNVKTKTGLELSDVIASTEVARRGIIVIAASQKNKAKEAVVA